MEELLQPHAGELRRGVLRRPVELTPGTKRTLSAGFFGAVAARLFSKKDFVGRPHSATPTRPSLGHAASYSAFPHQVRRAVLPLEKALP